MPTGQYTPRISQHNVNLLNEVHRIINGGLGDKTSIVNTAIFIYCNNLLKEKSMEDKPKDRSIAV
jgi:hypothetical protein